LLLLLLLLLLCGVVVWGIIFGDLVVVVVVAHHHLCKGVGSPEQLFLDAPQTCNRHLICGWMKVMLVVLHRY